MLRQLQQLAKKYFTALKREGLVQNADVGVLELSYDPSTGEHNNIFTHSSSYLLLIQTFTAQEIDKYHLSDDVCKGVFLANPQSDDIQVHRVVRTDKEEYEITKILSNNSVIVETAMRPAGGLK